MSQTTKEAGNVMAVIERRGDDMPRTDASLTDAENALVALCGFEWSDTFGCWLSEDEDGHLTRWESTDDVLQECHANAALGYRAVPPDNAR